ncbi:hypothetical protein ACIQMY_25505 [Streptomyces sp. NPDC091368]|uniref:hypothetical protein n=1 Tax=Streptomyces sp. NPDC091368 TaxID=3365993 RepID=UPI003808FC17
MRQYGPIGATHLRPIRGGYIQAPGTETTTHDIDWVAVERAINTPDCCIELNLDEKRAACILMDRAGYTPREISTQLCIYQRQVERWKRDGKPLAIEPVEQRICSIAGCEEIHRALGLCSGHYDAARRTDSESTEPRKPREPARCGTRGGYKRHSRLRTPFCDACRAANTEHGRELARRRAEQQLAA